MKTVCIIGLGYIGLPTAAIAANFGLRVIGYDNSQERIEAIKNNPRTVLPEQGLDQFLEIALSRKTLHLVSTPCRADYFVIAVPTPFTEDKKADLSYIWQAIETIIPFIKPGTSVIIESTVPVGTTQKIATYLEKATGLNCGQNLFVAYCPERVLPSNIVHELIHNNRVLGGLTPACALQAADFYKHFVVGELHTTTAPQAEMVKLVENSYRDVNLAFSHEVAAIASQAQLNPYETIDLANRHPRVNILHPRCGVGGHCIAIDPFFLIEGFPEQTSLLKTARSINDTKPYNIVKYIENYCAQKFSNLTRLCRLGILGATYKPNVDDLRQSPALFIIQQLIATKQYDIQVCEPHVKEAILQRHAPGVITSTLDALLSHADIIICLVDHALFKQSNQLAFHPVILDFCGLTYARREVPSVASSFKHSKGNYETVIS
jgi:UDP-N-acetyl-D-mannosaminuronic acid dehydrogenase